MERIVILSEVAWDSVFFNPKAYRNLLAYLKLVPPTGILVDGALTRLDRPEILGERLTYWEKSMTEAVAADEKIPNHDQIAMMWRKQLDILERRLKELKIKSPEAQIVLSVDADDLQFTLSAALNELLLKRQHVLSRRLSSFRQRKNTVSSQLTTERSLVQGGKGNASRLKSLEAELARVSDKMKTVAERQALYREKKTRPMHQQITGEVVAQMYQDFQEVCDRVGITLMRRPGVLTFGNLTIDFAHSRHFTWSPIKGRVHSILKELFGRTPRAEVVLESGHSGFGYKQCQKLRVGSVEANFQNSGTYDPQVDDSHVTVAMALPFEDQVRINAFMTGGQPVRMSAGKPMGTRSHAVFQRYKNDSVSGLTVITKDEAGLVGTEWIQYRNFVDGTVLAQPKTYYTVVASADEHIAAPEQSMIVRDGLLELFRHLLVKETLFRGRPALAAGYLNGGDVAEANSDRWKHRYGWKEDPRKLMAEYIYLLKNTDPKKVDELLALSYKLVGNAMQGSVESMQVILERVADYWIDFLKASLDHSTLRFVHASVAGNHTDDILRNFGLRESDFFVQRLRALGIEAMEVGKPRLPSNPRVAIGGYSSARILNLPQYGLDVEGKPLFGPINLVVQHDPKGTDHEGLIGAGKRVHADVALAGHTHDTWLRCYKTGDNTFSMAYRLATLQTVTPTEMYYASSVPRTSGAHLLVMPMPGDFSETVLPVDFLAQIGRDYWRAVAESAPAKSPASRGKGKK